MTSPAVGDEFPGNSYNNAARPKKIDKPDDKNIPIENTKLEKVIDGSAIVKKKSAFTKFKETFTGDDARSVGQYVFFDLVVPQIKSTLSDVVSQGFERLLFGDNSRGGRTYRNSRDRSYTPYNRMYRGSDADREERRPREISNRGRANHSFEEIILESRNEAEQVLDALTERIRAYDIATVSDLYDAIGQSWTYQDSMWGWKSLSDSRVIRVREGHSLDLPAPEYLGK